jgi:hypothetical protein
MKIMSADDLLQLHENVRGPIAESVYATGYPSLNGASHG